MTKTKLEMDFLDALNKNHRMSIDDPRTDLTNTEISIVMDTIVNAGVFVSRNGDLTGIVGARVVTTTVDEMEL